MNVDTQGSGAVKTGRGTTVSLIVLCQSFQALAIGGIALLLPIIRADLGLNFAQGGSLAAAASLVYAFMQIPAGYLSDRFNPKRLFIAGILGSTILSFVLGLVTHYWQALAAQALSGFFRALLFTPGIAWLTGWFPENRRATATGLYLIGGFSGSVVFNLAGPLIVARFDWRFAFMSLSLLGIIAALFLLRFGKEPPKRGERRKFDMLEPLRLFRYPFMWLCGGIQFIRLAVMQGIVFWLPSLLIGEKGLSLQLAGVIIAMQAVLTAPSNLLGGYVSDRLKNPILVISGAMIVLGITAVLLVSVNSLVPLIIVIGVGAIFLQMHFGPLFSIPVELLGPSRSGITIGFSNFFANLGAFSFVYLLGAFKDASGSFAFGFYVISGACFVGLVFTLILARMRRKALAPGSVTGRQA